MGGFASSVQQPQTGGGGGKGQSAYQDLPSHGGQVDPGFGYNPYENQQAPQPMGKGGVQTNSATSGQPRIGQQNQYSNTVGQWDNKPQQSSFGGGKGKGGMGIQQTNVANGDSMGMIENTYHPELANKPYNPQSGA